MAEKDITEKILMLYADSFIQIVNYEAHVADKSFSDLRRQAVHVVNGQFSVVHLFQLPCRAKLLEKEQKEGHIMMCEYINALEARGEARGEATGAKKGEAKLTSLLQQLYALGRD